MGRRCDLGVDTRLNSSPIFSNVPECSGLLKLSELLTKGEKRTKIGGQAGDGPWRTPFTYIQTDYPKLRRFN